MPCADPAQRQSRPLFFIAHSVGGLVVKQAIVRASQIEKYRGIWYNCHGVTFFGETASHISVTAPLTRTASPHRGSSYMSMWNLSQSIQELLYLQHPLPTPIAGILRLGHRSLIKLHEDFTDIASELRIWSFYETIDSRLSGLGSGFHDAVSFSAPLVSISRASSACARSRSSRSTARTR